jgi:hypothetical protein
MGYGIPFRGAFSAYISKEALMRIPALAILTIATVLTAPLCGQGRPRL